MYNNFDVKDISAGKGGMVELKVRLLPETIASLGTPPRIALADPNRASFYVSPEGWGKEAFFFTPVSHSVRGEELTMVFDRQLTNSIAMQLDAGYLVAFEGSAGHSAALVWGQVARASDQLAQSVQAKPVVAPQPVTPVVDPAQGVDTAPSTGVAATEAGAGAAVGGDHPQLPPEPPQTSRWPLPMWLTALIGVILLLLLLGIGGWFFLTKMRPDLWDSLMSRFEQTSEPAPVAQQQPEPVPEPVTAPEPAAAPAPVPTPFERGRAAFDAGDCTVARDTLQQATDAGDLEALLFVPQQIDSRDFKPCLTEQPNDVAALRHLTAACGVDAERSRTALSELEAELTRLADRGDVTAGEVLRLAMPKARAACGL